MRFLSYIDGTYNLCYLTKQIHKRLLKNVELIVYLTHRMYRMLEMHA